LTFPPKGRRGWQLLELVEEAAFSAEDRKRPGMQEALRVLESGEAEALVASKLDTPSRSLLERERAQRLSPWRQRRHGDIGRAQTSTVVRKVVVPRGDNDRRQPGSATQTPMREHSLGPFVEPH